MEFHAEVLRGGRWHQRIPGWQDLAAVVLVLGAIILIGTGAHQMVGPFIAEHQRRNRYSAASLQTLLKLIWDRLRCRNCECSRSTAPAVFKPDALLDLAKLAGLDALL